MITSALSRRANALLVTLIVLVGAGSMLALTSDRLVGTRTLQSLNLARQQASYAAEAVASLVETKLVQASGDLNNLTKDVVEVEKGKSSISQRWLQQGLYHQGQMTSTGMWVGNSLVYWRIEPVKIYDRTIEDTDKDGLLTNKDSLGKSYTDNYQANPNEIVTPTTTWTGKSLNQLNPGYYHFRIVTQSFYINQKEWSKAGLNLESVDPWNKPQHAIAGAQTQRMVQLKLINLFRYVIFYGANGATGDIELNPGAELNIRGAVHTNGALYLGGQGKAYLSDVDKDYQNSASSFAGVHIGSKTKIATITGVDGIFRTRKVGNFWYQQSRGGLPSMQDPENIPIPHALNGNDEDSKIVTLNGTELTLANDTRSGLTGHSDHVRDRKNLKATTINTLANIPQLAGYPFEHQLVVGSGQLLYRTAPSAITYTIRPQDFPNSVQVFYQNPPNNMSVVETNTTFPVYASDLPLYTFNNRMVGTVAVGPVNDIWPNLPVLPAGTVSPTVVGIYGDPDTSTSMADTFLKHTAAQQRLQADGMEARGYYLEMSLFGQAGSGRTGLTIRERGAQNTAWLMLDPLGVAITGIATRPLLAAYPSEAAWVQAMSAYMARNYVVYFGFDNTGATPADITAAFFGLVSNGMGQMVGTYTKTAQLPVLETGFINRREADSLRRMGFLTALEAASYQADVLTLNIGRIQEIIRSTDFIQLFPTTNAATGLTSRTLFNGMIYAHRTPRLGVTTGLRPIHDPSMPLAYHPVAQMQRTLTTASRIYGYSGGLYPIIGSVTRANINGALNSPDHVGDPLFNVWTVFPSNKQVRVTNGATIDWGGVQTSGRNHGLTVVTPNHCYVHGNYNTVPDSQAKFPPCGVYADGMTMLTNQWVDTAMTLTSTPAGSTTTYNVSFVTNNIPTDYENSWDEGSGGTHNLLRFLENGGRTFNFLGSMVVLNRMRYGRNYLGAALGYYGAPTRVLNFNDDLLTAEGQPPFSPWGIQVTRVLSSVNIVNR